MLRRPAGGIPSLRAIVVAEAPGDGGIDADANVDAPLPLIIDGGTVLVDPTARTVTSPAGVTTRELLNVLADVAPAPGWTLPTFPWFIDQTIGGAVATGSHGSSLSSGTGSYQGR